MAYAYLSNPVGGAPAGLDALDKAVGISRPQTGFAAYGEMQREAETALRAGFRFCPAHRVSEIQAYLALNYEQPLRLEELAARFYMNKTYLCDIFRKECGKTVVNFQRDIRMAHATHLLITTGSAVQQIAADVGYGDSAYFTKVFRSLYGVSPEAYRRKYKK